MRFASAYHALLSVAEAAFLLLAIVTGVIPCVIAYAIGWAITLDGPAEGEPPVETGPGSQVQY